MTTDYYWPHVGGGVQAVVEHVAERLVQRGHRVSIITLNTRGAPANQRRNGVWVFRLACLELAALIGLQLAVPLEPWRFWWLLRRLRPDLLHVHNRFFTTTVLGVLFRRRTPVVFTIHLGPVSIGKTVDLYEGMISPRLLNAASAVTAVSSLAAQVWPSAKVIPNGVDTELFKPSSGRHNFMAVFLGRLIRNKGPQRLLEAVPYLPPEIRIVFVGDGPLRSKLESRTRDLGAMDRVVFLGERSDVHRILPLAGVLVRVSDTEGMSLAVLEALACGIPVIASAAGAGGLIEHGVNGFLLLDTSPREVARYIDHLFRDPQLSERMSHAARRTAESYSWERCADAYEQTYAETVEKHAAGRSRWAGSG